jgi:hypothetical protein
MTNKPNRECERGGSMTPKEQAEKWLKGESVHNSERDECCPDFSCCRPDIVTPTDEKGRFCKAMDEKDEETINQMLMIFLARSLPGAHVCGDVPGEHEN